MFGEAEGNPLAAAKKPAVDGTYQSSDGVKDQIRINKLINDNYHL